MKIMAICMLGIVFLVSYLSEVVPVWFIFKKYGIEGWKALIPIYNMYAEFEVIWNRRMFGFFMGSMLTMVIGLYSMIILFYIFTLVSCIIITIFFYKRAKAFGYGSEMVFLQLFFPIIGVLIIAFGKREYINPNRIQNEYQY